MLDDVNLGGTSLAALASRPLRVASAPLATVTELVIEALGRSMGSPSAWPGLVRGSLEPGDLALLGPVFGGDRGLVIPESLLPRPESFASSVADDLERVASVSADEFVAELDDEGLTGPAWRPATREPRRWLGAYVSALERAWTGVAPLWAQAAPVLEREIERVAVALAHGNIDLLLDGLPKGHAAHDRWFVQDQGPPAEITDDLVFVPMVTGPKAQLVGSVGGRVHDVAYPVPGAHRIVGQEVAEVSALDALLGSPRAAVLCSLDRPVTAGALAARLMRPPSSITHHLVTLERAGLIRRERVGQHVYVHRTSRGTALLALYEP